MADYSFYTYAPDILVYNSGNNTFTLDASYDYTTDRNLIEYSDDDAVFDGFNYSARTIDDGNQVGTARDDEGNLIKSGHVYVSRFAQLDDGVNPVIFIDRIEIDGVRVGYVPSSPLTPGTTYSVTSAGLVGPGANSEKMHSYYSSNSVPCFEKDMRVATPSGPRRVIDIAAGDKVGTLDAGSQPVCWRSVRHVSLTCARADDLPVLIPAGALAPGRPSADLIVSGQHRILIGHVGQGANLLAHETFVPAKALVGMLPGVRWMRGRKRVTWVHLALAGHAILTVNGVFAESLLLRPQVLCAIAPLRRHHLRELAYQGVLDLSPDPARPCLGTSQARRRMAAAVQAQKCARRLSKAHDTGEKLGS